MPSPQSYNSRLRTIAQAALAAAALITAGRICQLAVVGAVESHKPQTAANPSPESRAPSPPTPSREEANAELAELYKACPLAAVIDLQTVATSPEKVDAILPSYRETAAHEPVTPVEAAVPRITYPIRVGRSAHQPQATAVRVAQLPRIATSTPAVPSDWLVDPKEWLTQEDPASNSAAANNLGDVSGADASNQPKTPSASRGASQI